MPHDDDLDTNLVSAEAALHAAMRAYVDAAARVHEGDGQESFFAKQLGVQEVMLEASAFFASEIAAECRLAGERLDDLRAPIIELVRSAHGAVLGALERELPDMLWAIAIDTEHSAN